jgi:hypothetical protein
LLVLAPDMMTRTAEEQERKATLSQLSQKNLTEKANLGFGQKVYMLGSVLATFETDMKKASSRLSRRGKEVEQKHCKCISLVARLQ